MIFLSDGVARENIGRAGGGNRSGRGRGRRATSGRGRGGHGQGDRSEEHYNEQHEAQFLLDSVNDLESDVDAYTDLPPTSNGAEDTEIILQQSNSPLPKGWIILDSASTVCMFSDALLLHGIHTVAQPLTVRCNARNTTTNMMGYNANIPEPISYNRKGIANMLLLERLQKHFHIAYDNSPHDRFTMDLGYGTILHFETSKNGLYRLNLSKTGSTLHGWTMVTTVRQQKEKYTKRAVQATGHISQENPEHHRSTGSPPIRGHC